MIKNSVNKAVKDAYAVYGLTTPWTPEYMNAKNPLLEYEHGKTLVDCVVENKVKYFIWSTLHNSQKISAGKIPLLHFTNKAKVADYLHEVTSKAGVITTPICVYPGFYLQNIMTYNKPTKTKEGIFEFRMPFRPDIGIPLFDVNDTGYVISSILRNPEAFKNKHVHMCGPYIFAHQISQIFSKVTGLPTKYVRTDIEEVRKYDEGLAQNVEWMNEFGFYNGEDLTETNRLFPQMNNWESWLRSHKWRGE